MNMRPYASDKECRYWGGEGVGEGVGWGGDEIREPALTS